MSIANRIQAYSASHPLSINRKLDQYLSENLPDMMDEYKVADSSDLKELDGNFETLENRMGELNKWRGSFSDKIKNSQTRMNRLKLKFGVE